MAKLHEIILDLYRVEALMSNSESSTLKLVLAAYIFTHHTHDGMEICELVGVSPKKLDRWTRSPAWKNALKLWNCQTAGKPEGEKYTNKVTAKRQKYRHHKTTLYKNQLGRCAGCLDQLGERHLTIDHIVPLSKGGTHKFENLQLLCFSCNALKGNEENEYLLNLLHSKGIRIRRNSYFEGS